MRRASHWVRTRQGDFRSVKGLPLTDRGFRYGMAVFETVGVWDGRPAFLTEHLQCLHAASVASKFPVEMFWLKAAGEHLLSVLNPSDTGVARLHVTAGDGGPADTVHQCRLIVSFERRQPVAPEVYERGYRLLTCPERFVPTFHGRKTHNYWPNIAALAEVRAAGGQEGIVVGPGDEVLSVCMANLFLVSCEGETITPGEGNGARAGVVRRWVLDGGNVREAAVQRTHLTMAREAFITSSWLGIMPVAEIDGRPLNEKSLSYDLMQKYQCHLSV